MVKVKEYFNLKYGANLEFLNMGEDPKGIPFVARTEKNNGVVGRVKLIEGISPNPANTISVACSGSVMASFLQEEPYYSGRDLYYLTPKIKLNQRELLYYCLCLKQNAFRYSYGRQANKTLKDLEIPAKEDIPSWVYSLKINEIKNESIMQRKIELNIINWKWFKFSNIFDIKKGKRLTKEDQIGGNIPYISSSSLNNGVDNYIGNGFTDENCISFACYGSIGEVFYQSEKVWVSDNANVFYLREKQLNPYLALFLVTILKLEQYRFSYGMTGKKERLQNFNIKLPVDKNENPDWQFMENYVKSLAYSSNL